MITDQDLKRKLLRIAHLISYAYCLLEVGTFAQTGKDIITYVQEIVQAAVRTLTDDSRWDGLNLAAVLLDEEALSLMTDEALASREDDDSDSDELEPEEAIVPSVGPMSLPAIGV